jgi:TRAP-type C4-dicarboxylate transport system permease small subunit
MGALRRVMDGLYLGCVVVSGVALVIISVVVPWGVFMRYGLNSAASWPEPLAILLTVLLTFLGGAACYRTSAHMRVMLVRNALPRALDRAGFVLAELLMAGLAVFMVVHGTVLVETTWYQQVPEFPALRVGITYLPIPVGGFLLLCFVAERLVIGPAEAAGVSTTDGAH